MCFKMSSFGFSFFLLSNFILVIILSIFFRLMTSCISICNLLLSDIPKDAGAQASHETSLFHNVFTPKENVRLQELKEVAFVIQQPTTCAYYTKCFLMWYFLLCKHISNTVWNWIILTIGCLFNNSWKIINI